MIMMIKQFEWLFSNNAYIFGVLMMCPLSRSEEDSVPELAAQLDLLMKAAPVPVVWAVVDNADISFYTLTDIELPVDISLGWWPKNDPRDA